MINVVNRHTELCASRTGSMTIVRFPLADSLRTVAESMFLLYNML